MMAALPASIAVICTLVKLELMVTDGALSALMGSCRSNRFEWAVVRGGILQNCPTHRWRLACGGELQCTYFVLHHLDRLAGGQKV